MSVLNFDLYPVFERLGINQKRQRRCVFNNKKSIGPPAPPIKTPAARILMSGGASGGRGGRGGNRADMSQPHEHIRRGPGLGIQPSFMGRSNTSSSSSSSAPNPISDGAADEQNRNDSEDGSGADGTYKPEDDDDEQEDDDPEEEEEEEEGEEGEQEGVARPAKKRQRAAAGGGRKVQRRLQARGTPEHLSNNVLLARLQAYEKGYRALTAATTSPSSSSASASNGDGSCPSASGSSLGTEKKRLKNEKMLIHCFTPDVLLKGVNVIATELASEIWKTVRFSTPFLEDEAALYSCAEELFPCVMNSLGRCTTALTFDEFWNPPAAASKVQGIKGGKAYVYRKVRDIRISQLQRLVRCPFPCKSI